MPAIVAFALGSAGAGAVAAQLILLRELLSSFSGNELSISLVVFSWLLSQGIGVPLGGYLARNAAKPERLFSVLLALFALVLPCALLLARLARPAFGVPLWQGLGFGQTAAAAFLVMAGPGLLQGAIFPSALALFDSPGKIYGWLSAGTLCGGLLLSLAFHFGVSHFTLVFAAVALCLAAAIPFAGKRLAASLLCLFGLFTLLPPSGVSERIG
nr:hypothetical protein [Elusimicrobiales bacterium]